MPPARDPAARLAARPPPCAEVMEARRISRLRLTVREDAVAAGLVGERPGHGNPATPHAMPAGRALIGRYARVAPYEQPQFVWK